MFLWLEASANVNTQALLPRAIQKGMAYVPGAPFYAGKPKQNTLRLNFTHATDEEIMTGMHALLTMFQEVEEETSLIR
ncbi:hypothetical protein [Bacillus sp. JCM 19041]|uniref:hypothetical protein n=1 Tax=Bacillus sp. JCM 19041 TaxID=1460637 RepID=UPI000A86F688